MLSTVGASIALLPLLALGQSSGNEYSSQGTGAGPYVSSDIPNRVDVEVFEEANRHPNASHAVSFDGIAAFYDLPSGGSVPKWSWSVNVTDVPVGSDSTVTNSVHAITFPPDASLIATANDNSVLTNASSTRGLCAYTFIHIPANLSALPTPNDGSCAPTLGQACTDQLTTYLSSHLSDSSTSTTSTTNSTCPSLTSLLSPSTVPACAAQGFTSQVTLTSFDLTGLRDGGYESGSGYFYTATQHAPSDTAAFGSATTDVQVLLLASTALRTGDSGTAQVANVTASQALCLRANGESQHVDAPGAAPRVGAGVWGVMGAAVLVGAFFM